LNLPTETVIEPAKLRDYLLSLDHPDGRAKAAYLALLGYTREHWEQLARDLRADPAARRPTWRGVPMGRQV
jgi:hypothetical protein